MNYSGSWDFVCGLKVQPAPQIAEEKETWELTFPEASLVPIIWGQHPWLYWTCKPPDKHLLHHQLYHLEVTWKAKGYLFHPFALDLRLQILAPKTSYSLHPSTIASTGRDKREREGRGEDFFLGPDYGVMKRGLPQCHPKLRISPALIPPPLCLPFPPLSFSPFLPCRQKFPVSEMSQIPGSHFPNYHTEA